MKITVDSNQLITIANPNIPQSKEYTQTVEGYTFSSYDKGILTYHKKQIKIINLKNLGDTMAVFYLAHRAPLTAPALDKQGFMQGLKLFQAFDEETGETYYFFPRFAEQHVTSFNETAAKLGISCSLQKTKKGICLFCKEPVPSEGDFLSQLFALTLLYGKLEIKDKQLKSARLHLPLFGVYLAQKEKFDQYIHDLQKQGIMLSTSTADSKEGLMYQINITDYEVLQSFAKFYQAVEKLEKITKYESTLIIKNELIEFIKTKLDGEVGSAVEGKQEILADLEQGTLKILTK